MTGYFVALAAFLMQASPRSTPLRIKILDAHLHRRADARESVGEQRNQRAITETYNARCVDGFQECARLVGRQDCCSSST